MNIDRPDVQDLFEQYLSQQPQIVQDVITGQALSIEVLNMMNADIASTRRLGMADMSVFDEEKLLQEQLPNFHEVRTDYAKQLEKEIVKAKGLRLPSRINMDTPLPQFFSMLAQIKYTKLGVLIDIEAAGEKSYKSGNDLRFLNEAEEYINKIIDLEIEFISHEYLGISSKFGRYPVETMSEVNPFETYLYGRATATKAYYLFRFIEEKSNRINLDIQQKTNKLEGKIPLETPTALISPMDILLLTRICRELNLHKYTIDLNNSFALYLQVLNDQKQEEYLWNVELIDKANQIVDSLNLWKSDYSLQQITSEIQFLLDNLRLLYWSFSRWS